MNFFKKKYQFIKTTLFTKESTFEKLFEIWFRYNNNVFLVVLCCWSFHKKGIWKFCLQNIDLVVQAECDVDIETLAY